MVILSDFSERFKGLLFENNLTPENFAQTIGVSRASAYRWTVEPMQIKRDNLIAVADYFQCSIEFLIGRTDNAAKIKPKPCPDFSSQVRKVMKEQGYTTYSLRKTTKFNGGYFNRWEKGEEPGLPLLIELADLFKCTVDYLVGRE